LVAASPPDDWLIATNESQQVFSIEKVGDETEAGNDELADWATQRGSGFFLKPDATMLPALGTISQWATGQSYEPAAVSTFLQGADYYLVAHALAHGHTVVTHEVASASTKKIKIPDACISNGVKCMNRFEMLRRERARFVLEPQGPTPQAPPGGPRDCDGSNHGEGLRVRRQAALPVEAGVAGRHADQHVAPIRDCIRRRVGADRTPAGGRSPTGQFAETA